MKSEIVRTGKVLLLKAAALFSMTTLLFPGVARGQSVPSGNQALPLRLLALQKELNAASVQVDNLKKQYEKAKAESLALRQLKADAVIQTSELGISLESFPEVVKILHSRRVDLLIDLAGLKARQKSLMKLKEGKTVVAPEKIDALKALLNSAESILQQKKLLQKRNVVSQSEIQMAEQRVLEIRVRLAESTSPPNSRKFDDDLMAITLDQAEKDAQLEEIQRLLSKTNQSRSKLDSVEEIDLKILNQREVLKRITHDLAYGQVKIDELKATIKDISNRIKQTPDDDR